MSEPHQKSEHRSSNEIRRTSARLSRLITSVVGVSLSVVAGAGVSALARGRNVSDVGLAIYENGAIASVAGTVSYLVCAALTFVLVSRGGGRACGMYLPLSLAGLILTVLFLRFS